MKTMHALGVTSIALQLFALAAPAVADEAAHRAQWVADHRNSIMDTEADFESSTKELADASAAYKSGKKYSAMYADSIYEFALERTSRIGGRVDYALRSAPELKKAKFLYAGKQRTGDEIFDAIWGPYDEAKKLREEVSAKAEKEAQQWAKDFARRIGGERRKLHARHGMPTAWDG